MNTFKYIWRNVLRNKLRTSLTVLSVGFSLALMTVLHGYMAMNNAWGTQAEQYNRIVVMNIQGFSGMLPIAHVDKVRQQDGVVDAVPYAWFGGKYEGENALFAQFGTDADHVFNVWPEFKIDETQLKEWQEERQGCVVDKQLALDQGWKVGDQIRLEGTFYPFNPDLKVCGIFEGPDDTGQLWFHWKYLDEALKQASARGTGNSGTIFAKVESGGAIPGVVKAIDERFASSDNPTRTQTEAAFAQMFADMLGDVQSLILFIGMAVVFSLSLVAANAMAMSMRERTTEIAVLKAIGFQRGRVLRMILGESFLVSILGGVLGVGLGCLLIEAVHHLSVQAFPLSLTQFAGPWLLNMLGIAAGIGLVSGIVPAIRASQLSVIDGLRRVV